jgi:flavin-dependent dehydrogenase
VDRVDALIVGGGPAGSTCAWALKKAGIESLVLDAQDFPRTKLCAGWITPSVVRLLELESSYPHGLLTFRSMPLEYHGRTATRRFTLRSVQHSIRRYEFDHWLLQRSGARFERHEVREITREQGSYIVDGRFQCTYLVGAGGTHCPVRRAFFADDRSRSRDAQVAALEEEFHYPRRDETCRLWFLQNGLAGYSWFVPKGNGWINIGLGAFSKHLGHGGPSLREHWQFFVRGLAERGLVRDHAFQPRGHTYYVRAAEPHVRRDNCLLVGDSAGLATRDLGEGIGPAVESGLLAAQAIATGKPYAIGNMTKYSYLPPGRITNLAERMLDRDGRFFRDRVFGRRSAA